MAYKLFYKKPEAGKTFPTSGPCARTRLGRLHVNESSRDPAVCPNGTIWSDGARYSLRLFRKKARGREKLRPRRPSTSI